MIVNNVVPNRLHQELSDAGVECNIFHNLEDGRYFVGDCEIKFAEGTDMVLVQQIIDTHDATPLSAPITELEELSNYVLDVDFRVVMLGMGL